jgi:hypothetical protein
LESLAFIQNKKQLPTYLDSWPENSDFRSQERPFMECKMAHFFEKITEVGRQGKKAPAFYFPETNVLGM